MSFIKGDVILPKQKQGADKLRHPAVVWEDYIDEQSDFCGIMLTGAGPKSSYSNIPLDFTHFQTGFRVPSKPTFFVDQVFIKLGLWGPFELVGRLNSEGLAYVEAKISKANPVPFDVYLQSKITP